MSGSRPNILLIVADDLGFSDIGCFGSEISTPNLDRLAASGSRFTNFHTAAACSPTRSMIMSGTDNHLVGLGGMIEIRARPEEGHKYQNKPGHQGFLGPNIATLPEVLGDAGYHTILTGKWHLGNNPRQTPASRGFDRDWGFMWGAHNHYAYEPQFDVKNEDDNTMGRWLKGCWTKHDMYTKNGKYIDVQANLPRKDDGFYSTTTFTDHLLEFFDEWERDPKLRNKPFFSYHAFTAPHWPLQAPPAIREKYKGKYDEGPAVLRQRRLARLEELGLIQPNTEPHPVEGNAAVKQWDEMNAEEKAKSARAMEVYAAMVELIDQNVGRIVDKLESMGRMENTLVVFMSDNGAEGGHMEATPVMGPAITNVLKRWYNNSLDNIGEPDSFVWYGPYWAQAATAPGRLYKMCSSEGGIRVPFLVHWPESLSQSREPGLEPGSISHEFGTCMDLMPTFLELAGAKHPGKGVYHGREVLPMTGKDWIPWMTGQETNIYPEGSMIGWELHGRAAFRRGDHKLLWMPKPLGKGQWELFDLRQDPGENHDLAASQPQLVQELLEGWDQYVVSHGVLWGLKGDPDTSTNPHIGFSEEDPIDDPKGWMDNQTPGPRP